MSRLEELDRLVDLFIWAGDDDKRHVFYQFSLREARPSEEELDYIDRTVKARKAQLAAGHAAEAKVPVYLPTQDAVDAFRDATPLSRFYKLIYRAGQVWKSDDQNPFKAYVMACFSELAYLHLTQNELAERDRYKIFEPSLNLMTLKRRGPRLDLAAVVASTADIRIEIIETPRFVYIVAFVNSFVVIAVRGTVSIRDWAMDFEALKNPAQNGFYHRGFGDEAERALPLLTKAVGAREPIYITGHSLGAAVASILTQVWPNQAVARVPYVFASPRFGTQAAAQRLIRYSYLRPRDIVPHLPPKFLGYSDSGATTTVLPAGSKQGGGWGSLWYTVSRRTAEQHIIEGIRKLLGDVVGEHFPERVYMDALLAKLKKSHGC